LGITIQILLIGAILTLGSCDPRHNLTLMGALSLLVAFLSRPGYRHCAWRVEILQLELQGPGAGMIQTGYRIAMLVSGAGALVIAARRLVRGLCHHGGAARRGNAGVPVWPRAESGGGIAHTGQPEIKEFAKRSPPQ